MKKPKVRNWSLLNYDKMTLDEWESYYYNKGIEELNNLTSSQIWMRSVENAGTRVAEFIRREEYRKAIRSLGYALGLLCFFTRRFREDYKIGSLSEIVWHKYPGMCYGCAGKVSIKARATKEYTPCECLGMQGKDEDEDTLEFARKNKKKPLALDDWGTMVKEIYEGAHSALPMSAICLHFIEEIGEVTKELFTIESLKEHKDNEEKMYLIIKKLEEEIADAFSWILGLLNKIDHLFAKARDYYAKNTGLLPLKVSDVLYESLKTFPKRIIESDS